MEPFLKTCVDENGFMLIESDQKISAKVSRRRSLSFGFKNFFDSVGLHLGSGLAIDLGAYIGDSTTYFLENGYDVIAVEADPLHFKCLEHNCPTSTNINCVISEKTGETFCRHIYDDRRRAKGGKHKNPGSLLWTEKEGFPKAGANDWYSDFTESRTLDDITSEVDSCHVLKMDIQGFEPEAIRGGVNFIKRCKPIIITEVHNKCLAQRGASGNDLIQSILDLGYSINVSGHQDLVFTPRS